MAILFAATYPERTAALVARWRGEGREIGLDGLLVLAFLRGNAFITEPGIGYRFEPA